METSQLRKQMPVSALFDPKIVVPAIGSAFVKLDPRRLMKNPVMFVLEVVTALTTVILIRDLVTGGENLAFEFQIVLWLWFTVLFANFAEAIAEGRGKAQAESLRRQRTETQAKLLTGPGGSGHKLVPSTSLKVGDVVLVEAGDVIPSPDRSAAQGNLYHEAPALAVARTSRSSRVSPPSTRRRSPASQRRSSANPAATARP
jgi:potassium-transporting ATPase ATP-binding subunit